MLRNKVKYVIWNEVPVQWGSNLFYCGGCVALCVLFDCLKELGAEVYLSHEMEQSLPELKEYQDKDFFNNIKSPNLDEFVAIYPEITIGNPLNCRRVVRWLLHYPDEIVKGVSSSYQDSDMLFAYTPWVAQGSRDRGFKVKDKLLNTFYVSHNIFYDQKQTRKGECHIVKKGHVDNPDWLAHSIDVTPYCGNPEALSKIFNKCENFCCYDDRTWLVVLASLCGCNSIIPNPKNQSKEEYFKGEASYYKKAVAYGAEDLPRLKVERKLLKAELIKEQQLSKLTVKDFIEYTSQF